MKTVVKQTSFTFPYSDQIMFCPTIQMVNAASSEKKNWFLQEEYTWSAQ